jgi:adenylate kinase
VPLGPLKRNCSTGPKLTAPAREAEPSAARSAAASEVPNRSPFERNPFTVPPVRDGKRSDSDVKPTLGFSPVSDLNLILLGPPGSGKGTQGERLQEDFRLPYYATGDILREAVREGTDLGKEAKEYMDRGDLVPDDVIVGVIGERVSSDEAQDGFILDGFPRTEPQAEALDEEMVRLARDLTAAVLIDVPDEEVVRRLSGRRICSKNGHVFHVDFDPPKNEDVCDVCGARLLIRDDDKPEVVQHRLEQYHEKTEPLISYYEDKGLLRRVDGSRTPEEVSDRIRALLATLKMEEQL